MKKNVLRKVFLKIILAVFIIMPVVSFAQSSAGTQSQVAPSYNAYGVAASGSEANVNPTFGSNATSAYNGKGVPLGTTSTFTKITTSTTSTGISCVLDARPTLGKLIKYVNCTISRFIVPLVFGLAMVLFIWGVVQYVINTDDETKKKKGKMFMIWGIVALSVMVSVWGLVKILGNTFGVDTTVVPQLSTGPDVVNDTPITSVPTLPIQQIPNNPILPGTI
jgi:hypothetical protein